MTEATKVLLLEDDDFDAADTCELLKRCGARKFTVRRCKLLSEAVDELSRTDYPVALIDMNVPDSSGLETVAEVLKVNKDTAIVVLTGTDDRDIGGDVDITAMEFGAADYLVKGKFNEDLLERSIRFAITRQKLMGAEIRAKKLLDEKNQKLLEYYQTANSFVDTVSHEFRTPLTVIKEFASVIREGLLGDVNDEQQEYLETIVNRVNDLSDMVGDLLDVSKLEQGSLGICRQAQRVDQVIHNVQAVLESKAAAHDVSFDINIEDNIPEIYCDAEKIGRVIINLAVNGFKFSKQGGHVALWARYQSHGGEVVFGVTDSGPGIPADELEKIFGRFTQLGGDIRKSTQGFGLGLSIAKELVQLNFGDINVKSEVGKGSTFTFTVPTIEPATLLRRFKERVGYLRDDLWHVGLIGADFAETDDTSLLDEVYALLHQELRSNDLILRQSSHNWRLVVTSIQPDFEPLIDRLDELLTRENQNRADAKLPAARLSLIGHWNIDGAYDHFLHAFENHKHADKLALAG